MSLVKARHIPAYKLETAVQDPQRGVEIRRKLIMESLAYKDLVIDGYVCTLYDKVVLSLLYFSHVHV